MQEARSALNISNGLCDEPERFIGAKSSYRSQVAQKCSRAKIAISELFW
jgi:hypothetical protein